MRGARQRRRGKTKRKRKMRSDVWIVGGKVEFRKVEDVKEERTKTFERSETSKEFKNNELFIVGVG